MDTASTINNLGLAAPQIGYGIRAFVMKYKGKFILIINPTIIKGSGKEIKREGCLSVPGETARCSRYKRITVTYWNRSGDLIEQKFINMAARIFQHEYDHLDGILIK